MASVSVHQFALFENFTIDPKLREQTFPGSSRNSLDSTKDSIASTNSKRSKFKLHQQKNRS
ncbi:hypothetical protein CONCODRAFT_12996 [Conidiobolus coronatus NRRL 28638]|uniref:Uncharacterized protein n=1 Tax=Conidiobolus coronatus (strain ATCC 28846 / CBS 209.66 / NRRL 28638) TaxID=796925 RepID=A0A137NRU2_CONC2|nr:hypothetical protein CONCODRAFT_12996 [Conidiobolus coronatus NRRL 28638]|eukprot:KXN65410.1 hypothetical protein CONCODRAFT_12996 [Conidiobolus coronatus NRRL 28638]